MLASADVPDHEPIMTASTDGSPALRRTTAGRSDLRRIHVFCRYSTSYCTIQWPMCRERPL